MPYARSGAIEMYYESFGEGPPLLLVSGTGWSGEHWKLEQVPALSDRYRVIVFDHRGVGRSARPDSEYSTRLFAEDAIGLLDAVGVTEPAHLLGHSMGGRVIQWMALEHPERIRSLVLAATGPGEIDARRIARGLTPELVARFVAVGWPGYNEEHLRGPNNFYRASAETIERFVATHRGQFGTDVLSYLRHVEARQRHQVTERLKEIQAPCLVIVGEQDAHGSPSHLETSRYLASTLSDAEFVLIEDVAHCLHIETADAFNTAVADFLKRH